MKYCHFVLPFRITPKVIHLDSIAIVQVDYVWDTFVQCYVSMLCGLLYCFVIISRVLSLIIVNHLFMKHLPTEKYQENIQSLNEVMNHYSNSNGMLNAY